MVRSLTGVEVHHVRHHSRPTIQTLLIYRLQNNGHLTQDYGQVEIVLGSGEIQKLQCSFSMCSLLKLTENYAPHEGIIPDTCILYLQVISGTAE